MAFINQRKGPEHSPKPDFLQVLGETNTPSRSKPLSLSCCRRDAVHSPLLSSGIQPHCIMQLTPENMGGPWHPVLCCLLAPHERHHCHHPSKSSLPSQLLPPWSLVWQVWWGCWSASFWDMKCSIWKWEPEAKKQEAVKVLKGIQALQGNDSIPYVAQNTSYNSQSLLLSN